MILICLNRKNEDNGNQLTGLLNTLLSTEITVEEKKKTLAEKYEIETDNKLEKEMNLMCNLSQAIKEDGIKIGEARGRDW